MQREPNTWTADTTSACWPTVWRHKWWSVQWHPGTLFATLGVWASIVYLNEGHTKAELFTSDLLGAVATLAALLGSLTALGLILSLGHCLVPKFLRKTEPSIGLVEIPCTIGFFILLKLLNT
jgi:hypothetical protein